MPGPGMKSETRAEARARFEELRQIEEEGYESASEGQLALPSATQMEEEFPELGEARARLNESGVSATSDDREEGAAPSAAKTKAVSSGSSGAKSSSGGSTSSSSAKPSSGS